MDIDCTQVIEQDDLNGSSQTITDKSQIQVGTLEIGDVRYPILRGITKIGRYRTLKICLDDTTVSKFHAEIEANGRNVFIGDLQSSNKTRLNGAVLTPSRFYQVQDGAFLKFGGVEARFFLKRAEDKSILISETPKPRPRPGLNDFQNSVIEVTPVTQDDASFRRPAVPNRRKIPMRDFLIPGDDLQSLETQVNSGDDIQDLETQSSTLQHDRTTDSDLQDMETQMGDGVQDLSNMQEMETQVFSGSSRSVNSPQSLRDGQRNIQEVDTQLLGVGNDAEGDALPGLSKSPSRDNDGKSSDRPGSPGPSRSLPDGPSNIQDLETQAATSEAPSKDHPNDPLIIHDLQTQIVDSDDHIKSLGIQKTEEHDKSRGKRLSQHEKDMQTLNAEIWGAKGDRDDDNDLQDIHAPQTQTNVEFSKNSKRREEEILRSQSSSPDLIAGPDQMVIDDSDHDSIFDDEKSSSENRRGERSRGEDSSREDESVNPQVVDDDEFRGNISDGGKLKKSGIISDSDSDNDERISGIMRDSEINEKSLKNAGKSACVDDNAETDFEDDLLTPGNQMNSSKNNSKNSESSESDLKSLVSEVEKIFEDSSDEINFDELGGPMHNLESSKNDLKNCTSSKNKSKSLKPLQNNSHEETDFEEMTTLSNMSSKSSKVYFKNSKSSKIDSKTVDLTKVIPASSDDDTDFEADPVPPKSSQKISSKNNPKNSKSSGNDLKSLVSEVENFFEDSSDETTNFDELEGPVYNVQSSKNHSKDCNSSKNNSKSLKPLQNDSDEETDFEEKSTLSKMSSKSSKVDLKNSKSSKINSKTADFLNVIPASSDDDTDCEADPFPPKSSQKGSPEKPKLSSESSKSVRQTNRTISIPLDPSECGNDWREPSRLSKPSEKSSKSSPENDSTSSKVINGHSSSKILKETVTKSPGVSRLLSNCNADNEDLSNASKLSKIINKSESSRNNIDHLYSDLPPEVLKMLKLSQKSNDVDSDDDDDDDPYNVQTQIIVLPRSSRISQKNNTNNLTSSAGPSETPGNHSNHEPDCMNEDLIPTQKINRKFMTKSATDFDDLDPTQVIPALSKRHQVDLDLEPTQKVNHSGVSTRKKPRMLDFDDDLEPTQDINIRQVRSRDESDPCHECDDDFDDLAPTQIIKFDKTQTQERTNDSSSRKRQFQDEENTRKKRMKCFNDNDPEVIDVQAIKRKNNLHNSRQNSVDSRIETNVKMRSHQMTSSNSSGLGNYTETGGFVSGTALCPGNPTPSISSQSWQAPWKGFERSHSTPGKTLRSPERLKIERIPKITVTKIPDKIAIESSEDEDDFETINAMADRFLTTSKSVKSSGSWKKPLNILRIPKTPVKTEIPDLGKKAKRGRPPAQKNNSKTTGRRSRKIQNDVQNDSVRMETKSKKGEEKWRKIEEEVKIPRGRGRKKLGDELQLVPDKSLERKKGERESSEEHEENRIKRLKQDDSAESTTGLESQEVRRTLEGGHDFKCQCVLFTGLKDHENEDREIVESLGGTITTDPHKATILVTDKVRRTVKFFCAVSRGIPIVSITWLQASVEAKKFLEPETYILHDPQAEARFKFSLGKSLARARNKKLLRGKTIILTPKLTGPSIPELKIMVQMAGGKPMLRAPSFWPDKSVIVSCPDDLPRVKKMIARIQNAKVYVVHIEFLLSGILRQQLDYREFALHV